MSRGWQYNSGDWIVTCDVCSKQIRASESKKRWDGLIVCPADFEHRHPQDLIKHRTENTSVPFSRPEPTDTFTDVTYIVMYEVDITYSTGDAVYYNGDLYYSEGDNNTGNAPGNGGGYWLEDSDTYSDDTTYAAHESVTYAGEVYYSISDGNIGNTPVYGGSAYWATTLTTYEADVTYGLGDSIIYENITYYSWADVNLGNSPASSPLDWRILAPHSDYTISNIVYTPPYPKPFPGTTTAVWDIMDGAVLVGTGSGSYISSYDSGAGIASAVASNWPNTEPIVGFTRPVSYSGTIFSGSTQWSGNVGWTNYAWFPAQSSGSWYAAG